jgi:hypothetical protein
VDGGEGTLEGNKDGYDYLPSAMIVSLILTPDFGYVIHTDVSNVYFIQLIPSSDGSKIMLLKIRTCHWLSKYKVK